MIDNNKSVKVRVRIAPSPTGFAHIGTAYSGLFNWAFARKNQGVFVLRLEDTDQKRQVPEAERVLYDAFDWLGIPADESPIKPGKFGPYRQSERLDRYQQAAAKLVSRGQAYEHEGALWLKLPDQPTFYWDDLIRGRIEFTRDNLKDWVIQKSDGFPTYSFANVVDDHDMEISHVIRGEEHISNTPLQLTAYTALDFTPPQFAHLPVLRGPDRKKLSKRRDPVSLQWFREQGYLPEALINFLCLQGWSHPQEKDFFSKEEFAAQLTLDRVKTSAPVFDFHKLDWLNGNYLRCADQKRLVELIAHIADPELPKSFITRTLPLVKDRMKKLSDFSPLVLFFHHAPSPSCVQLEEVSTHTKTEILKLIENLIYSYEKSSTWSTQSLEMCTKRVLEQMGWENKHAFMTLRVTLTGKTATPPLYPLMEILGKPETLARLAAATKILG